MNRADGWATMNRAHGWAGMNGAHRWATRPERGGDRPARLLLWVLLRLGWAAGWVLLPPIVLFYLLVARDARQASRRYLGRALGRTARLPDLIRHFHRFAIMTLDRVYLLAGQDHRFQITIEGLAALDDARQNGRGVILLGAHYGSFEILRTVAARAGIPARALMFRRNRGTATALLENLCPALQASVIDIGEPGAMLRVQDCLLRGDLVGMLADRAPGGERVIPVPFFGEPAPLPAGPLLVAAMLGAPVLLVAGRRTGSRRYVVRFEPFAECIRLSRTDRMAALRHWVARYAARLEAWCRAEPFDWFNFHDVWHSVPSCQMNSAGLDDARPNPVE